MHKATVILTVLLSVSASHLLAENQWPKAEAPVIPEADGYAAIPNASFPPKKSQTYKAVFDATRAPDKPTQLVPALNMAGSELNALGVSGVPLTQAKFAIVFHGDAVDGLLNDDAYRSKFGASNPNLPVLAKLKTAGVELYVCGQYLASAGFDKTTLSPDVAIASDALLVLITYQSRGYALMSF